MSIIRISKNEKYFLAANSHEIYLYQTTTQSRIKTFKNLGYIINVEFSKDESQLYVGTDGEIKILDI